MLEGDNATRTLKHLPLASYDVSISLCTRLLIVISDRSGLVLTSHKGDQTTISYRPAKLGLN